MAEACRGYEPKMVYQPVFEPVAWVSRSRLAMSRIAAIWWRRRTASVSRARSSGLPWRFSIFDSTSNLTDQKIDLAHGQCRALCPWPKASGRRTMQYDGELRLCRNLQRFIKVGAGMPGKFKINTLSILALSALFYFFFMTAKHDPALSAANAFAEDPYDAVGSFAIQAAALIGVLSALRAFRPYRRGPPTDEQKILLARTQILAALAVIVTLASDIVAMARYPSLWIGPPGGYRLANQAG